VASWAPAGQRASWAILGVLGAEQAGTIDFGVFLEGTTDKTDKIKRLYTNIIPRHGIFGDMCSDYALIWLKRHTRIKTLVNCTNLLGVFRLNRGSRDWAPVGRFVSGDHGGER
jgi:hypothetical protein